MLPEKIYTLRRKNGLSQEQLAEKIGVSRQAISKWEGGLSTPELDKLKALSECFHITLDELTDEQAAPAGSSEQEPAGPPRTGADSKLGVCLCLTGAVCLILFGVLMIARPSAAEQLNASSTITLNGSGMFIALSLLLMVIGMVLVLKKK